MKRLSPRFKKWLSYRQKKASRARRLSAASHDGIPVRRVSLLRGRHLASVWNGQEEIIVEVMQAPTKPVAILCFDTNYQNTANFLGLWQKKIELGAWSCKPNGSWLHRSRKKSRHQRLVSYYDFSVIKEISTSASVVIAAEYERGKIIVGAPPPAVNLHKWSNTAFGKLYQMGFFEAVGLSQAKAARFVDEAGAITMQIVSGGTGDKLDEGGEALEKLLIDNFHNTPEIEGLLFWINTAVSEALTNVSNWAYEEAGRQGPRRWWLAATLDPVTKNLAVVVYDQGLTIPKSIMKRPWYEDMVSTARSLIGIDDETSDWTDSTWIAAALEYGRSRTRKDHRGKGLPQMAEILDHCPGGSLRIVSRTGCCYLEKGKELVHESPFETPINGTLIEWKLSLPVPS